MSFLTQTHMASSPAPLLTPPATPEFDNGAFDVPLKVAPRSLTDSRPLSDNELSYYLPARAEGVNDMYLHHTFKAPSHLATYTRVLHIWAYQLLRHPLLAASVYTSGSSARFVLERPTSLREAMTDASRRFRYAHADVVDNYLNGPRTLNDASLSTLVFVGPAFMTPPSSPGRKAPDTKYEFMLCAAHFIGDGMALHTFMNEFYTLLGSNLDVSDLEHMIDQQLDTIVPLPQGMEERFTTGGLQDVAGRVALEQAENKLVGGQAFPTVRGRPRRTVVPTFAYTADETKRILSRCKANGVTIAHVVFALCNIAWSRVNGSSPLPCMLYSALNLRPAIPASPSFFHLAVGYFNIVLPSLLPDIDTADLLWHRAKATKAQTIKAVKSPFLVTSSKEMNRVRRDRAVRWAAIDDGEAAPPEIKSKGAALPQKALMGVSMLGNLDGMYRHTEYPAVKLNSLMTGSRQRAGGLLLFAYTFNSRLWLSLGYDMNGFQDGVIESFWSEVQALVEETLL